MRFAMARRKGDGDSVTQWIKHPDDTEWKCRHCGLVVTSETWEQVMIQGTQSFPQCNGDCAPKGVISVAGLCSATTKKERR